MKDEAQITPSLPKWFFFLFWVLCFVLADASVVQAQHQEGFFIDAVLKNRRPDQARNMVFGPDRNLYITSLSANNVSRYDGASGKYIDEFVTPENGGLDAPRGMTFGPDGNLYISSFNTNEVLRFNGATGAFIDSFIPVSAGILDGPAGLLFLPDHSLLVSNINTDEVIRFSNTGEFLDILIEASPENRYMYSLVLGPDGLIYAGSFARHEILRFNAQTGHPVDVFVAYQAGGMRNPYSLAFGQDNNLYVGHLGNAVLRFDGKNGAFLGIFATREVWENIIIHYMVITFGPEGQLYVYDNNANAVFRYHGRTSQLIDTFVSNENEGIGGPFGLLIGPDSSLYVAGFQTSDVIRVHQETGIAKEPRLFCCPNTPFGAFDLVLDNKGRLLVSSFKGDKVVRYNTLASVGLNEYVERESGGLDGASGMAIDADSLHLLVGSIFTDEVLRYDLETGAFIDVFISSGSGGLDAPHGVIFGSDGHLYVGSYHTNSILRYDGTTGAFIDEFVASGSGGLNAPQDHTFGPDGHLYVSSLFTNEVLRYDGETGDFINVYVPALRGGLDGPRGLIFSDDNILYVSSFDTDEVLRFTGPSLDDLPGVTTQQTISHHRFANYPNPFEQTTRIRFRLEEPGHVRLTIFDVMGRQLQVLIDGEKPVGNHEIVFDAGMLASGVYVGRLEAGGHMQTIQLSLIR